MSRFIPVQLQSWTRGRLIQTVQNAGDAERHYTGVSKDTRTIKPHEVYVALAGPHFDGHDFALQAAELGAAMLVLQAGTKTARQLQKRLESDDVTYDLLLVEDTLQAFQDIAFGYRQTLAASVIGVTGSVGKTTTRRMIHCLVSPQMKAMQTFANLNNEIGLSETLLNAQPEDQVLVTEIAMDRKGEIRKISAIARPDIAVITGIGYSHAEYLGSLHAIFQEKTSIIDNMKDNALCIVNGDDAQLEAWACEKERKLPVWFIASEQNTGRLEREGFPVFWAEDIVLRKDQTAFTARSSFASEQRWPVVIPEPGRHLIPAALFGLAAAYALGLDMKSAADAASRFENTGNRQKVMMANGMTLIDDSYNASPESMRAALEVLSLIRESGRSVAVIGGMRELGRFSEAEHIALAKMILEHSVDRVFLIGEEARPVYEYLADFMAAEDVAFLPDLHSLIDMVRLAVRPGDTVLIKGSRLFELEKVTAALTEVVA